MQNMRALIVSQNEIIRHGLLSLLSKDELFSRVQATTSAADLTSELAQSCPDVVFIDSDVLGTSIPNVTRTVKERCPAATVMVLTTQGDFASLVEALSAGAEGFLHLEEVSSERLRDVVLQARSGALVMRASLLRDALASWLQHEHHDPRWADRVGALSPRDFEVLRLMAQGYTNQELAQALSLTVETIKKSVQRVTRKMKARNRAHAAAMAVHLGLVSFQDSDLTSQPGGQNRPGARRPTPAPTPPRQGARPERS